MTTESMRERFEAWFSCGRRNESPELFYTLDDGDYELSDVQDAWTVWQAATLAERERAAKVCESLSVALDNGGNEYRREASASASAKAIRKGE